MKHAPKYIQICIRRMFYHQKVVTTNAKVVKQWMINNRIPKSIPLNNFLEDISVTKGKKNLIAKGQMSIFDYLK